MVFPTNFWILFSISAVFGFITSLKQMRVRMSFGLNVIAIGLALLALYRSAITAGTLLCCLMLIASGAIWIKGGFGEKNTEGDHPTTGFANFLSSLVFALIFAPIAVFQIGGLFYRLHNGAGTDIWVWIGIAVMAIGLFIQIVYIRKPTAILNLLIQNHIPLLLVFERLHSIFFIGVFISGIGGVKGVGQWIVVLLGLVLTLLIRR